MSRRPYSDDEERALAAQESAQPSFVASLFATFMAAALVAMLILGFRLLFLMGAK